MAISGKAPAKAVIKERRKKTRSPNDFRSYIFKVFRQVAGDGKFMMSKHSMPVLNSILLDLAMRIGEEASRLVQYARRDVMKVTDIQTSIRLVLQSRELCRFALEDGNKKVAKFIQLQKAR